MFKENECRQKELGQVSGYDRCQMTKCPTWTVKRRSLGRVGRGQKSENKIRLEGVVKTTEKAMLWM